MPTVLRLRFKCGCEHRLWPSPGGRMMGDFRICPEHRNTPYFSAVGKSLKDWSFVEWGE